MLNKVYIQSGKLLNAIKRLIRNLGEPFEKGFAALADLGVEIDNVKEQGDKKLTSEHIFLDQEGKSHPVFVDMTARNEDKSKWLIEFTSAEDSSLNEKFDNIDVNDLEKVLPQLDLEVAKKFFGLSKLNKVHGKTEIGVTLQKVTTSEGTDIELGPVRCSSEINASEAYSMIDQVCQSDDFANTLIDQPVQYCLADCGDSWDINECAFEPTTLSDILWTLFVRACEAESVARALVLNKPIFKREGFEILWILRDMQEGIAGLYTLKLNSPIDVPGTFTSGAVQECELRFAIQTLIDALNIYYANVEHDIQYKFDAWINRLQDYIVNNPMPSDKPFPPLEPPQQQSLYLSDESL